MRISERGLALIKRSEGFRGEVYLDQAGLETIGYGHLLTREDRSTNRFAACITEALAEEILRADVAIAEAAVAEHVKAPPSQGQFDALVDFVYNLGEGALARSQLLRVINAGELARAPEEFLRWDKARNPRTRQLEPYPGLTRRREREVQLWRTGTWD